MKYYIRSLLFVIYPLMISLSNTDCQRLSDEKNVFSYPQADTLIVDISYDSLMRINYTRKTEPLLICLRDMYAFRTDDIDMHFEHSDIRQLYGKALNISLDSISDEELLKELKKFYLTDDKHENIGLPKGSVRLRYLLSFDSLKEEKCRVNFFDLKNVYYLEKRIEGWKIVERGRM